MPDDNYVREAALQYLEWYGPQAISWLIDRAEIAEGIRDHEAAKVWREIAAAARAILRSFGALLAAAMGAAQGFPILGIY